MRAIFQRTVLVPLCLVIVLGSVCLGGLAAPAPFPRPKARAEKRPPAPAFLGHWGLTWGSGQGEVIFSRDGGYWCLWAGQQWVGTWRLEKGRLVVTEGKVPDRPDGVPDSPMTWTVDLHEGGHRGVCHHAGSRLEFRLTQILRFPKEE